ncbi:MAG: hypothetical protein D6741_06255, partial [Planctomycetota bacterium]
MRYLSRSPRLPIPRLVVVSSIAFGFFLFGTSHRLPAARASEIVVHVSPQATAASQETTVPSLEEALRRVRELRKNGNKPVPATITIHAGTYPIEKPLVLTPEDSGTLEAPFVIRAAGDGPVVISGGKPITGWRV